nr:PKD domain-containing protein [Candidatus Sigynarchaeota archaeon]
GSAAIQDDVNNDNTFFNNTLVNNSVGLYINDDDRAYFNAFINNTAQIDHALATFYLHNGTHGNYYSDYTSRYPAATNNGVTWNTPYTVPGGSDPHPLVNAPATFSPSSFVSFIQNSSVVIEGEDIAFSFKGHLFHPSNANFTWDFGDGNNATGMNPVHGYATAGTYVPTLTVEDGNGENFSTSALNPITVEVDTVPTVEFDPAGISGDEGTELQLNFTGTTGNEPVTFEWVFGDGTANSTQRDPRHTYQSNGTYTANLTVRDRNGDTGTGSLTVTVENLVPIANFNFNGNYLFINESMRFYFNGTLDNDPATYSWDFGDGSAPVTGRYCDKTYSQAGYYTVTINVTDGDGDFAMAQRSVYVNDN